MRQDSPEFYPRAEEEELDTDISDLEIEENAEAFPYNDKPTPNQERKSFKENFSEKIWYKARIGGKCFLISSFLSSSTTLTFWYSLAGYCAKPGPAFSLASYITFCCEVLFWKWN